jgi:hypothetical protein
MGTSQNLRQFIQKNAFKIESLDSLNKNLYPYFKDKDLIMIGEMHGTEEPAKFVKGLYKLFSKFENKVNIGLEALKDEFIEYLKNPSDSTLLNTIFFSKENIDGRNGKAWFDLITFLHKQKNVNLFFFDDSEAINRDSFMYSEVVTIRKKYPKQKIITLSGNIHNWLIPFKNQKTLGAYCVADEINFIADRIVSINHIFQEGTMLNNTGNGLQLKTIQNKSNIFSTSVPYQNYFISNFIPNQKQYNHYIFTRKVNHSALVKSEK